MSNFKVSCFMSVILCFFLILPNSRIISHERVAQNPSSSIFVDGQIPEYPDLNSLISVFSLRQTANRITFDFEGAQGFDENEIAYLEDVIAGKGAFSKGIYDCVEMVFGHPFESFTVKLVKTDDPINTSNFNPVTKTMTLVSSVTKPDDLFPKLETVMHEIVHAFSGSFLKQFDNFEEGFAVEMTVLAGKLFCDSNQINDKTSKTFNGIPIMLREYELYNQPAVSPPFGMFWRNPRVIDVGLRYHLAGAAWHKIWRETSDNIISYFDPQTHGNDKFFVVFNNLLRAKISDSPAIIQNTKENYYFLKSFVRDALKQTKGDDQVEGESFEDWWSENYILSYEPFVGDFLYGVAAPNGDFPNMVYYSWPDKNSKCHIRWLDFFSRNEIGDEIYLEGQLFARITSKNWNGLYYDQDITANVSCEFASEPGLYFSCDEDNALLSFIKTKIYNGFELNFGNLPLGVYGMEFFAKNDSSNSANLSLFFANKVAADPRNSRCILICPNDPLPADYLTVHSHTAKTYLDFRKKGFIVLPFKDGDRLTLEAGNSDTGQILACKIFNMPNGHSFMSLDTNNEKKTNTETKIVSFTDSKGNELSKDCVVLDSAVSVIATRDFNASFLELVVFHTNFIGQKNILAVYRSNIGQKGELARIELSNLQEGSYELMARCRSNKREITNWTNKTLKDIKLEFEILHKDVIDKL